MIVKRPHSGSPAAASLSIVPPKTELAMPPDTAGLSQRRVKFLPGSCGAFSKTRSVKNNIKLLYGFSFLDQFMIVFPLLVPYLATKGISMAQFMELQAMFALAIVASEVPTGLLSDRWGRKKVLLWGAVLKAASFSLLPLLSSYGDFVLFFLTLGIAFSMISGGDVALLYESQLAADSETSRSTAVLGNAKLSAKAGAGASALVGGAVVTLSYGHLLWANAILGWMPVLLALAIAEPASTSERTKKRAILLSEILAVVIKRDAVTRLVFFNMVACGLGGLVMIWTNQKYWQDSGVPLAYFGALYAGYSLIGGFGGRLAAVGAARYGLRPMIAAVGVMPVIAYFGMAMIFGWGGIALGLLVQLSTNMGQVLFLSAINERIPSGMRATVISMATLSVRASFSLLGPLVGYGIDGWGLPSVLSAIGLVCSSVFVVLFLPLVLREAALGPARSTERA
jgi:hypothetical protein